MERRMANIWKDDMNAAWQKRDISHLRFLLELAELVPGMPPDCRPDFAQRIQDPQALGRC
jgi:hypothetical protein